MAIILVVIPLLIILYHSLCVTYVLRVRLRTFFFSWNVFIWFTTLGNFFFIKTALYIVGGIIGNKKKFFKKKTLEMIFEEIPPQVLQKPLQMPIQNMTKHFCASFQMLILNNKAFFQSNSIKICNLKWTLNILYFHNFSYISNFTQNRKFQFSFCKVLKYKFESSFFENLKMIFVIKLSTKEKKRKKSHLVAIFPKKIYLYF